MEHSGTLDIRPIGAPESAYAAYTHDALIDAFYESEGSPEIGRELSTRLFQHAGLTGDPAQEPLIGRDGAQVQHNNQPLTLADYVNFAADHHFEALEPILDFLMTKPGEHEYETTRAIMLSRLNIAGR